MTKRSLSEVEAVALSFVIFFPYFCKKKMAYADFTLAKLRLQHGIEQKAVHLFNGEITPTAPSQHLQDDLAYAESSPLSTEKAKSELIISPILRELRRLHNNSFKIFSGYSLNVAEAKGLNGVCDYLLTKKADIVEPEAPIFCLVEAKNGVVEEGYGQCAAEMLAARMFNEQDGEPIYVIYGCVTNAFEWVFLKLEGDTIYIDNQRYLLNDLAKVLGILSYIVQRYQ
jgi:hypothetical protein